MHDPPPVPSGWFPDPLGRYDHRYFNGASWTSDVSRDGQRAVDPLGTSPGGSVSGGERNGAATAAVVMGSIGLAIAWIPFLVVAGAVLAVLAVIFGIRGLRRSAQIGVGRSASIAGTIMGGLGVALSVVGVLLSVAVWTEVVAFIEPGPHATRDVVCEVDARQVDVSGTIVNESDERRGYVIFVQVADRTNFAQVDDVAPGEAAMWSSQLVVRSALDECTAEIAVHGPFPFGLEVDAVNESQSP